MSDLIKYGPEMAQIMQIVKNVRSELPYKNALFNDNKTERYMCTGN